MPSTQRRSGRHRPAVELRRRPLATAVLFSLLLAVALAWLHWRGSHSLGWYGLAVGGLLTGKLALSLMPAQRWAPASAGVRVAVVVPIYNEDPGILRRNLEAIARQSYPVEHVWVVDDGSDDPAARRAAEAWATGRAGARVIWQPNAGKREAMAQAFRGLAGRVDVFVCVDSDTVLEPTAIECGLAPFADPTVAAATGTVVALNATAGLLPRLLDLRYINAFLYERAAYSRLGAVLCVCGSAAFWRAEIVAEHLEDFVGQRFLGEKCTYGDDRHLTNLSLLHGKVVVAPGALASTAVPERGGHLLRQQVRWGRSFFRETVWALTHLRPTRIAWWLAALEGVSWAGFTTGLLLTTFIRPAMTGQTHLLAYLGWVLLCGWGRSVHVFSVDRADQSTPSRAAVFALAPLYGMLHVLILVPLRLYSLATLRSRSWGTRAKGAEVSMAEHAPAATVPIPRLPAPTPASDGVAWLSSTR